MTDGEHVFVSFGSAGVACYDFSGKEIWKRDLGPIDHEWGNSTSPVLFGDLCILYHGPGDGCVLVALNKKSGELVWKFGGASLGSPASALTASVIAMTAA